MNNNAFRFHGILIDGLQQAGMYADVLADIAFSVSKILEHGYVREYLKHNQQKNVFTTMNLTYEDVKFGCLLRPEGLMLFGLFVNGKAADPGLDVIRRLGRMPEFWITVEEKTENRARQIARNENILHAEPDIRILDDWGRHLRHDNIPDYSRVRDLGLVFENGIYAETPSDLKRWADSFRSKDETEQNDIIKRLQNNMTRQQTGIQLPGDEDIEI